MARRSCVSRWIGFVVALCVALAVSSRAGVARADHEGSEPIRGDYLSGVTTALGVVAGVATAASVTTLVVNSVKFGDGGNGWRYAGYFFGVSSVLGGLTGFALLGQAEGSGAAILGAAAAVSVTLGVSHILVSYFSGKRFEEKRKVSLAPMLIPSARGTLGAGLSLQLAGW